MVIGVFSICPISLPNRVKSVDLVELEMVDFDVILGNYLVHSYFSSINCRTGVVKFSLPNEPIL